MTLLHPLIVKQMLNWKRMALEKASFLCIADDLDKYCKELAQYIMLLGSPDPICTNT